MRPRDAVRPTLYYYQASSLDKFRGALSRSGNGQNSVGIAMHNQCGHVNARHVFTEVAVPRAHAFERSRGRGGGCNIPTGLYSLFAYELSNQNVGIVEILEEFGEECVTVLPDGGLHSSEDVFVHALRIVRRL